MKRITALFFLLTIASATAGAQPRERRANYDLTKGRTLYTVGYAHLDTQWNWDYVTTIDEYLYNTLVDNFELFEKHPDYVFNFTGSRRYRMMKEYFPDLYAKMLDYIAAGRWYAVGSCVDEGEVNISSSESLLRQVLYGNDYYRKEFGKASVDYMLPDCFGFPATMPGVLAHAGLKGFSTQKLTWRAAVPIPFNVGIWQGPDGSGVIAALNSTKYSGRVEERLDTDSAWVARMDDNIRRHGIHFDYRYYGVGDRGGSPRPTDVEKAIGALHNKDSKINVLLTSSDQMYRDITPAVRRRLPRYEGDLLLIEHSAGSTTSQSFMKRLNRKNETLAKAAEQAAVIADWYGAAEYPFGKINGAWELILGNQMHDILPGTSIPRAYEYAWNDGFVAANNLSAVLVNSVAGIAGRLDTRVEGRPVVVYNPVAREREDLAEAVMQVPAGTKSVIVRDAAGNVVPSQVIAREGDRLTFIFLCRLPSMGISVFGVSPSDAAERSTGTLSVTGNSLENEYYKVVIAPDGDIASVFDKKAGRELLASPAGLEFQRETPQEWPAWNMDWEDRKEPPFAKMDRNVFVRIIEQGPVRVALEISREGENSRVKQVVSLAAGEAGKRVTVDNRIDWQTRAASLKAAFPLAVSNPEASYSLSTAVVKRNNNHPNKFEVPSREWFDLTDGSGSYGVSILEDCRYGSDKPDDNTLRLTLMFTPKATETAKWLLYSYQETQDFGIHDVKYAIYGHEGDWAASGSPWQAKFLNQPLIAFEVEGRTGKSSGEISFASASTQQVDIMAFKKMEGGPYYIVRLNELYGKACPDVRVKFAAPVAEAFEVDGQEQRIGKASVKNGELVTGIGKFGIRTFAVRFADTARVGLPRQAAVKLDYNADIVSFDSARGDGSIGTTGYTLPAEMLPGKIVSEDIPFLINGMENGSDNATECRGQRITLPEGEYNRIYLLAMSESGSKAAFGVDGNVSELEIAPWHGFMGQHYSQSIIKDSLRYTTVAIDNPRLRKDDIAWFASHHHSPEANMTYQYCYLYKYCIEIEPGARELSLPDNPLIKIVAATVAYAPERAVPLTPLYDDFGDYPVFHWREQPKFDLSHR